MGGLVIGWYFIFFHEIQDNFQKLLIFLAAQKAVQTLSRNQGVGASRIKSRRQLPVLSQAHRILGLVAVTPGVLHADDGLHDHSIQNACGFFPVLRQEQAVHAADAL